MKFSIGYQKNEALKRAVFRHLKTTGEIYFPWPGFTTGRGECDDDGQLRVDLAEYAAAGLTTNLLLNGNCYGRHSLNRGFYQRIGDTVQQLKQQYRLTAVTTTSPVIARFIKANFDDIDVRASVNMEIGTVEAISYLLNDFDSFYLKREYNYDFEVIKRLHDFCHARNKRLFILANSGCLNFCPARTFHDNLVAHQHEIAEMDNAFEFQGLCHAFLHDPAQRGDLLVRANFIRPEDTALYDGICDGMKLATRTNRNPAAVVEAYAQRRCSGNLLELTEPSHAGSFYPEIIAGDRFPADYAARRGECRHDCEKCDYCAKIQRNATLRLNPTGDESIC